MFTKTTCLICIGWTLVVLPPASCSACRYSVRDVGFVQRSDATATVLIQLDDLNEAESLAAELRQQLADAGMSLPVSIGENVDLQPGAYLQQGEAIIPLEKRVADTDDFPNGVVDALRPTDLHEQLLDMLIDNPCVVLLVESGDERLDQAAAVVVGEAIDLVMQQADAWAKPMIGRPQLVTLSNSAAARHQILLKSLQATETSETPLAMIVYGRLRRIGPAFAGEELNSTRIAAAINLLGNDCECDLGRAVFDGPTAPHVWTAALATRARKALGFDPEHPMVGIEVRQVLAKKKNSTADPFASTDAFYGYDEIDLSALATEVQPQKTNESRQTPGADALAVVHNSLTTSRGSNLASARNEIDPTNGIQDRGLPTATILVISALVVAGFSLVAARSIISRG